MVSPGLTYPSTPGRGVPSGGKRTQLISPLPTRQNLPGQISGVEQKNSGQSELPFSPRPVFYNYTDRDGLPQNSIMALAVDRKGYLWAGTQDGAAYYNGRTWTLVNMPNRTVSNYVRAVLAASDGSLWFGTNAGGLSQLSNGFWKTIDTATGLPNSQVRCLLETSQNGKSILWVGTRDGLVAFENGQPTLHSKSTGLPNNTILTLAEITLSTGQKTICVGTNGGLAWLEANGTWKTVTETSGLPHNTVSKIVETTDLTGKQSLWVATSGGLARFQDNQWSVFTTRDGLPSNTIRTLLETISADGKQVLWIGTSGGGIGCFKDGAWQIFDTRSGFPSNVVVCFLETVSPEGIHTLWIGTDGGGLCRVTNNQWQVLDDRSGLPDNNVFSVLVSGKKPGQPEALWIGTSGGGLAHFDHGKWEVFNTQNGLPHNVVLCLLETKDTQQNTQLWAGTGGGGIACFQHGRWTAMGLESGLPHLTVYCLLETVSPEGNRILWAGTAGGLARFENNKWVLVPFQTSATINIVRSLYQTILPNGAPEMWIGTAGGGLVRFSNQHFEVIDTERGLPNNNVYCTLVVPAPDGSRWLWVGTDGGGVVRTCLDWPGYSWLTLSDTSIPALPNNVVYQIQTDIQKRIYLFTNKGICRLAPRQPTPENPSLFDTYTFTSEDGLPGNECNSGASYVDTAGQVWVGTVRGAAVFNPVTEISDRTPKSLYLEQLLINRELAPASIVNAQRTSPVTNDGQPEFSYHENNLLFEFALLSYFRESDTHYQTQLVGFDKSPTPWTIKATREYTNLPAGHYTFQVTARDYAGNITAPLYLSFRIKPAPWRTWWAILAYVGLLGGGIYAGYAWRIRVVKRRQEERITYLRRLLQSTRTINSELEIDHVLQQLATEGARLVGGDPCGIGLVKDTQVIFNRVWTQGRWDSQPVSLPLGEGVTGQIVLEGKPAIIHDAQTSDQIAYPELVKRYEVHGLIGVPIVMRSGRIGGVLLVRHREGRPLFSETDVEILESLAHQAAVAIENAALHGELETKNLELEEKNETITRSVLELERLYQNELEVTRRLQELNQMKNNFMMVTSHEMRTPLTVLKGYNEALAEGTLGPLTTAQKRSLASCQRMVSRLTSSFDDILQMLKVNEGILELKLELVDLAHLTQDSIEDLASFVEKRHQTIHLTRDSRCEVNADQEKLKIVLLNLIQNAIKFTYDGNAIQIQVTATDTEVQFSIKDTGIGIEQSEIERIFDRFYTSRDATSHTSGQYEFSARGTGLGLSIAKAYIEAHQGRIWAESAGPGQGSTFHFVIPRQMSEGVSHQSKEG